MSSTHSRARLLSGSACEIGYVTDILMNILSRLPIKDVLVCKCVSKHFLELISGPQFAALHLSLSMKEKSKYIICPYPKEIRRAANATLIGKGWKDCRVIPLPCLDNIDSPEIMCFLNGLMCSVNEVDHGSDVDVRIFNPITLDLVILPRGSPSTASPSVGLAFDPETHNFKAFRFFTDFVKADAGDLDIERILMDVLNGVYHNNEVHYKCEVYTSGAVTWRNISEDVQPPKRSPNNLRTPHYVSVAGSMFWFRFKSFEGRSPKPVCILSVDMNDDFLEIPLPEKLHQWSFLIELEGCVTVVHAFDSHDAVDSDDSDLDDADDQSHDSVLDDADDHSYDSDVTNYSSRSIRFRVHQWKKITNHDGTDGDGYGWFLKNTGKLNLEDVRCFNVMAGCGNELLIVVEHNWEADTYIIAHLNDGSSELNWQSMEHVDLDSALIQRWNAGFLGIRDFVYDPVAFPFHESLLKCSGP